MRVAASLPLLLAALLAPAPRAQESRPAEEDSPALTEAAIKAADEGRFDEALGLLERARKARPEERVTATNLARMLGRRAVDRIKRGEVVEAEADLVRGAEIAPEERGLRVLRVGMWRERGELFRAEAELHRVLVDEPGLAAAFEELARCKYDDDDLLAATDALDAARKLDPARAPRLKDFADKLARELLAEGAFDRVERGPFVVKCDARGARDLAEDVLGLMDAAQRRARDLFAHEPLRRTTVVLYSGRDFAAVTGAHAWTGGLFDGKIRVPVRNFAATRAEVAKTLVHEYMHVVVRDLTRRCPLWLNEGLAQIAEGKSAADARARLRGRELKRLSALPASWFGERDAAEVSIWYAQGLSFTAWLSERAGPLVLKDLLVALDGKVAFAAAFAERYGAPFEELEDLWRETVR